MEKCNFSPTNACDKLQKPLLLQSTSLSTLLSKPYLWLGIAAVGWAWLFWGQPSETLEVLPLPEYAIVSLTILVVFGGPMLVMLALTYVILEGAGFSFLKVLSWLHVVISTGVVFALAYLLAQLVLHSGGSPEFYFENSDVAAEKASVFQTQLLLFYAAQLLFGINFLWSIWKRISKRKSRNRSRG